MRVYIAESSAAAKPADDGAMAYTPKQIKMPYARRRRTTRKVRSRRSYGRRRSSLVPRDDLHFSNLIRRADNDCYTTTVKTIFTAPQLVTKNLGDSTMFSGELSGTAILSGSRGFVALQDRFQKFMLHSATMECMVANTAVGVNNNILITYNPSIAGQAATGTGLWQMEASGGRLQQIHAQKPKAKFSLLGSILNEAYSSAATTGYVGGSPYKQWMSSNSPNGGRWPNIFFGNVILYSPGIDLTAANTPGAVLFVFTFKVSFAVPQISPTQ